MKRKQVSFGKGFNVIVDNARPLQVTGGQPPDKLPEFGAKTTLTRICDGKNDQ